MGAGSPSRGFAGRIADHNDNEGVRACRTMRKFADRREKRLGMGRGQARQHSRIGWLDFEKPRRLARGAAPRPALTCTTTGRPTAGPGAPQRTLRRATPDLPWPCSDRSFVGFVSVCARRVKKCVLRNGRKLRDRKGQSMTPGEPGGTPTLAIRLFFVGV